MSNLPAGLEIKGAMRPGYETILTPAALEFVVEMAREFGGRVEKLLQARVERQKEIDAGKLPDFLPETKHIRESDWRVTNIPADLQDRRVEITGPTDRKMVINALNSGAKMFMADLTAGSSALGASAAGASVGSADVFPESSFTDWNSTREGRPVRLVRCRSMSWRFSTTSSVSR